MPPPRPESGRYGCLFIDRDGRFLTVDDRDDPVIARTLGEHLIEWADTQPPLQ